MKAIEKFVEKRKLEVSLINDKYEGQVKQLELRGVNRKYDDNKTYIFIIQ